MSTPDLKQIAIAAALKDMMRRGYVNICTVDKCADLLQLHPKGLEAYNILSTLHCVNFGDIPQPLRSEIPALIGKCLTIESLEIFVDEEPSPAPPEKKTILQRLLPRKQESPA